MVIDENDTDLVGSTLRRLSARDSSIEAGSHDGSLDTRAIRDDSLADVDEVADDGSNRFVEGLLRACRLLTDKKQSTTHALRDLCQVATEACACDRSSLFLLADDDRFHAIVNFGNPPEVAAAFDSFSLSAAHPALEPLMTQRQLVIINDAMDAPGVSEIAKAVSIHSVAFAPLLDDRDVVGFLTIEQNLVPLDIDAATARVAGGLAELASERLRTDELRRRVLDQSRTVSNETTRRRRLLASRLAAEQRDRRRIADQLHRGPQQTLIALEMRLQMCAADLDGPVAEELATLAGHAATAHHALSSLMLDLDGASEHDDLETSLRLILESFASSAGWAEASLSFGGGSAEAADIGPDLALVMMRLLQESLANIRDHAGANVVGVDITESDTGTGLRMRISDDGVGAVEVTMPPPRHCRGLVAMHELATMVGGEITVEPRSPSGTLVEALLPVGTDAPHAEPADSVHWINDPRKAKDTSQE